MGSQRPSSPKTKNALDPSDVLDRRQVDADNQSDSDKSGESADTNTNTAQDNAKESGFESFDGKVSLLESAEDSGEKEPENDLDFSPNQDDKAKEKKQEKKANSAVEDLKEINDLLVKKPEKKEIKPSPGIEIVEGTAFKIKNESGDLITDFDDPIMSATIKKSLATNQIESIRYPCGKVRNFSYGEDSQIAKIETIDATKNRTFSKSVIEKDNGKWFANLDGIKAELPGNVELVSSGAVAFQVDQTGTWRLERPDGIVVFENEIESGARIALSDSDNILQVTRPDGSGFECRYENGSLIEITEYDKNGNKITWTKENGKWVSDSSDEVRDDIKIYPNGFMAYSDENDRQTIITATGKELKDQKNGSRYRLDSDGRFVETIHFDGSQIEGIKFNELASDVIDYIRVSQNSPQVVHYARQQKSDSWMLTITDKDGAIEDLQEWLGKISISKDGILSFSESTTSDIKQESSKSKQSEAGYTKILSLDETVVGSTEDDSNYNMVCGRLERTRDLDIQNDLRMRDLDDEDLDEIERVDDSRPESQFSGSVLEARERLCELMDGHLDDPQKQRFKIILDRYELRGANRVEAQIAAGQDPEKCRLEWDEKIAKSYDNLSSMLDPNLPNATYDLRVRAKLVESMAFSMACPVKANDQGNWGCCWMISGVFAGIIQHPDKMTDMLAQLSNTGQYTDLEGKTWTPPKGLLSITSQGGRWTIENCGGGHRSPVSEILTSVAAYLSEDGRRTDRGSRGGTGRACNHAMKKITGDTWTVTSERDMVTPKKRQELLEKGAYICIYPGHMYLGALEKHGDEWVVCASLQHGDGKRRINGTVSDLQSWTITGGRRRYNPDIDLPECQDSPTGPIGNNWPGGGGARDWPFPYPYAPDQWPLSISFAMRLIDEADRNRQKELKKEEEEERAKREKQRIDQERELAEIEAAKRRSRKAKEIAERREEEEIRRKKKEEQRAKKRREQLKKKKLQLDRLNRERAKKQKALDQAQSIENSRSNNGDRNNQSNNKRPLTRRLSEQILDINHSMIAEDARVPTWNSQAQNPSHLNGLGYKFKPVTNNDNPQVELVNPIDEIGPQLSNVLINESNTQILEKE